MKNRPFMVLVSFFLISCQLFPPNAGISTSFQTSSAGKNPTALSIDNTASMPNTVNPAFANPGQSGESIGVTPLKEWKETPYKPQGDELPINLEKVGNLIVTDGFTDVEKDLLSKNGFVAMFTQEEQFADIRNQVSENFGQPYYLTSDAAYHSLHITFDAMLKKLEEEVLLREAIDITSAMLSQVSSHTSEMKGTTLEADMQLAEDYLAVALKLFKEDAVLTPPQEKQIQAQIEQITSAKGRAISALIPGFEDDYSAYDPVGHYNESNALGNYFKGMTWLGRVAFKFKDAENPKFTPSRTPLIITQFLRKNTAIWERYTQMMDTMAFIVGPTDDGGPVEVGALMDAVYGTNATLDSLKDDETWQLFLSRADELPQPKINSTFVNTTKALNAERSWRMMGKRFTLDAMIFQNMIYDKVGSADSKREMPSGFDVMAVLGSSVALDAQKAAGITKYQNYLTQLDKLQKIAQAQTRPEWLGTFYSGWLYSFLPQIQKKGDSYPPLMATLSWQNREVGSALGSWAELKHDTVLYAKMPEFMGGGGPPSSPLAPGYVEPNPNVFYRLAYISKALTAGLEQRGYILNDEYTSAGNDLTFQDLWHGLNRLVEHFTGLGDIAVKELNGEKLTLEDFSLIQSPLGPLEENVDFAQRTGQDLKLPPVPVISAVSGANNAVLEAGVGKVNRIYVVVPINGQLQIAQGGIFDYYEFKQPRADQMSDKNWLDQLMKYPPGRMSHSQYFLQIGGKTVDSLAFRIGDVYIVNKKGATPPLNVRSKPTKSASVIDSLGYYTYFEITGGPETANNLTWWKIKVFGTEKEGWVAGNPDWYDRAHGQ